MGFIWEKFEERMEILEDDVNVRLLKIIKFTVLSVFNPKVIEQQQNNKR
jgi:hypothetical protein